METTSTSTNVPASITVKDQALGWHKPQDAAQELSISPAYLRKLAREGSIHASGKTAGGHRRYSDADLDKARAFLRGEISQCSKAGSASDNTASRDEQKPVFAQDPVSNQNAQAGAGPSGGSHDLFIFVGVMILSIWIGAYVVLVLAPGNRTQSREELEGRRTPATVQDTVAYALQEGYDEVLLRENHLPEFRSGGQVMEVPEVESTYDTGTLIKTVTLTAPRFTTAPNLAELELNGLDPSKLNTIGQGDAGAGKHCIKTEVQEAPVQACLIRHGRVVQILILDQP